MQNKPINLTENYLVQNSLIYLFISRNDTYISPFCKQEKSFGTICTSIHGIVHLPLYLIKTNCAYAAGVIFTGRYKLSTLLTVAFRNGNTKAFQLHHTRKKNKEEKPSSPDHREMRRRQQFGWVCLCVCKRNLPILRWLREL